MRKLLATLALATAFASLTASAADRIIGAPFATRSEVIAPHAMFATRQPLATQIARDVMKQGGSAVDAAIAANAALGLMEPNTRTCKASPEASPRPCSSTTCQAI